MSDERKIRRLTLTRDLGPYNALVLDFAGDARYVETNVDIGQTTVCVSWEQKDAFMDELAELVRKYQL
jgi:hypothetical protein